MPEAVKSEWLRYAFACPMVYESGEYFCYGNLAPYVARRVLEKVTGMNIRDYLFEKLRQPLGVAKPCWDADPSGHTFAASALLLDIKDMIKLGQIYLGKGAFNGHCYLSEDWLVVAAQNHVDFDVINPTGKRRTNTAAMTTTSV